MRCILFILLLAATSSAGVGLTVLPPIEETFGTAQVFIPTSGYGDDRILDAPERFTVGYAAVGAYYLGWIRWDLSELRSDAEILGVAVVLNQEPGVCVAEMGLGFCAPTHPLEQPFDVPGLCDDLLTCPVYTSLLVGATSGVRTVDLGAAGVTDLRAALSDGRPFEIALRPVEPIVPSCSDYVDGRELVRPMLHVVWNAPVSAETGSWGAVKSLYRP